MFIASVCHVRSANFAWFIAGRPVKLPVLQIERDRIGFFRQIAGDDLHAGASVIETKNAFVDGVAPVNLLLIRIDGDIVDEE